jgi:thiamine transport system permease protein
LADPIWQIVANSVWFAVLASVLAAGTGLLAAMVLHRVRGRLAVLLDGLVLLPLGASAVMLGLGLLLTFDTDPFDWRASWFLIPVAHALVGFPFVVRSVLPMLRNIEPGLREAAAILGASPRQVWRSVDEPIVRRAFGVGAGFAFAVSVGEFGATSFLARPQRLTMPTAIFRLLGRPGAVTYGQAMALSVVLMLVTATAILLIERGRGGAVGDF